MGFILNKEEYLVNSSLWFLVPKEKFHMVPYWVFPVLAHEDKPEKKYLTYVEIFTY